MGWLAVKSFFGLARWAWLLIAAAALIGAYVWLQRAEEADDRANQEIGGALQREGDLRETFERVEKGNEVRESVKPGSRAAYDECVRSARTPANCVGLLSDGEDN